MTDYSVKLNAMSDGGGFNWGTVSLTLITFEELGRNVGTFNKLWRTVGKFRELWGTVGNCGEPLHGGLAVNWEKPDIHPWPKIKENVGKSWKMFGDVGEH